MKARMNDFRLINLDWIVVPLLFSMVIACGGSASADLVTIWEDQFTSISPNWEIPDESTLVSQASPVDIIGSEDGFEGVFTNTSGTARYAVLTIPAGLVKVGDRVEYSIRANFYDRFAGDRIDLVADIGDAFDSGFVAHDSTDGMTFLQEPGGYFDLFDTTLMRELRAADNLYFGNNGYGGSGVESIFYVDYIRIVGEHTIAAGDYNGDGSVDAADYTVWRNTLGQNVANGTGADGDQNGTIEQNDYTIWKTNFGPNGGLGALGAGAVPEPNSICLMLIGLLWASFRRKNRTAGR